jgi:hypothetical protein
MAIPQSLKGKHGRLAGKAEAGKGSRTGRGAIRGAWRIVQAVRWAPPAPDLIPSRALGTLLLKPLNGAPELLVVVLRKALQQQGRQARCQQGSKRISWR